ncbi:hypothetical protein EMGBS15_05880 [Filimonas sp.]|jgi:hypothetical protein|nr:hypothetical protein EMGBS15_05880 [Filimonas sp.]
MKNVILIGLMLFTFGASAEPNSQYGMAPKKKKVTGFDKTRIIVGPGLGFGAGYRAFSFNISPSVAYCFTDHFHAGATLGFNYYQSSEEYTNPITGMPELFKHKYPAYSFSVYGRYLLGDFIVFNIEPELNNTKFVDSYSYNLTTGKINEQSTRAFIPSVLVGAGYTQRFNRFGYSYLMLCYDLLQNPNARYYQTIDIRAGIMLSLWN